MPFGLTLRLDPTPRAIFATLVPGPKPPATKSAEFSRIKVQDGVTNSRGVYITRLRLHKFELLSRTTLVVKSQQSIQQDCMDRVSLAMGAGGIEPLAQPPHMSLTGNGFTVRREEQLPKEKSPLERVSQGAYRPRICNGSNTP